MDKKATVFVVDCGADLSGPAYVGDDAKRSFLTDVTDIIREELANLVIWDRKTDQAGVIAWKGSEGDVVEICAMTKRTLLSFCDSIEPCKAPVNVFDGVAQAVDLILRHCRKLKYTKRIKVFSTVDRVSRCVERQEDKVERLAAHAQSLDIEVELFLLGDLGKIPRLPENFSAHPLPENPTPVIKPVRPVSSFTGMLTLGHLDAADILSINVAIYPGTRKAHPPTASSYYGEHYESISTVHDAVVDNVARDDTEPGFLYGSEIIPVPKDLSTLLKEGPTPHAGSFQIIAFVPVVQPWVFLETSDYILPGDTQSARYLSILARTLYEHEQGVLARYASPRRSEILLFYLEPYLTAECECLLTKTLPFNQDKVELQFTDFDKLGDKRPTDDMKQAMSAVVDQLTQEAPPLDSLGERNPYIERLYQFIKTSALQGINVIPKPASLLSDEVSDDVEALLDLSKLLDIQEVLKEKVQKLEQNFLATEPAPDFDLIFNEP